MCRRIFKLMESDYIEKITHRGKIHIGDITLSAMVSERGKRLITAKDVFTAVGKSRRGTIRVSGYPAFIGAKNLVPFIDDDLKNDIQRIKYRAKNGHISEAYDANIIPRVADLYIEAHNNGVLTKQQEIVYERSMTIVRSLAKLGITALIDEATGFQYDRGGQALQHILGQYIEEDLMKWQKRFPDEFYEEIYRLCGWKYDPYNPKKPSYVGAFTNKFVYGVFPDSVLDEIRKRNPIKITSNNTYYRSNKYFQYLTKKVGSPKLDAQLKSVIAVMKLSNNMEDFRQKFNEIFKKDLNEKRILDDEAKGNNPLF